MSTNTGRSKLSYDDAKARGFVNVSPSPTQVLAAVKSLCQSPSPSSVGSATTDINSVDPITHAVRFLNFTKSSTREVRNQVSTHAAKHAKSKSQAKHGTHLSMGAMLDVIPDRVRVTLKVALPLARAQSGGPQYYEFAPSNLQDPAGVHSAIQPVGFDQWMSFYERFIVMKSRHRVAVESVFGALFVASCIGNDQLGATGGFTRIAGQPRSWNMVYEQDAAQRMIETGWVSHNEVYGLTEPEFRANEDFYGTAAAAPANNIFFTTYMQSPGNNSDTTQIGFAWYWVCEMDVEFNSRIDLQSS